MAATYAELHCHTNFSFLDGASTPDELVERAAEIGLGGLAVTDHRGLYGVVRFVSAAEAAGIHPVVGIEIELLDPLVADPQHVVVPARRSRRRRGEPPRLDGAFATEPADGCPARPRAERLRLPGHREPVKEDLRGIADRQRGPHLVLLARDVTGYRSLCRLVSHANLAGTKSVPRFSQALLARHTEGLVALSGCRDGEIARRLRVGDRDGARAAAEEYARRFGRGDSPATSGFVLELQHHLRPEDDWLVAETAALADQLGLPVVVTNDVHYARPEGRELHDVLTAIHHGRAVAELGELRRADGESYLKSGDELAAMPPADGVAAAADARTARAWLEGIGNAGELAASCSVDLVFEQYRFPGFPVPAGETPFSYLVDLCQKGARHRYHPLTPPVVKQLAHELGVIEKTGLAEFFLICWDLMRFAKEHAIPA
ncbi:MAG TPA: PHP domain-containing protein, partial [Candidatus Limnocylindrales bacterium]|nr:PHP domain-containing protein [Candidatus Limnocylindrales bacterium]